MIAAIRYAGCFRRCYAIDATIRQRQLTLILLLSYHMNTTIRRRYFSAYGDSRRHAKILLLTLTRYVTTS